MNWDDFGAGFWLGYILSLAFECFAKTINSPTRNSRDSSSNND